LVSGYAHVFLIVSIVIVTLPKTTAQVSLSSWMKRQIQGGAFNRDPWHFNSYWLAFNFRSATTADV